MSTKQTSNKICNLKRPRSSEDGTHLEWAPYHKAGKLRIEECVPSQRKLSSMKDEARSNTARSSLQPLVDISYQSRYRCESQPNTIDSDVKKSQSVTVRDLGLETVTYVNNLFSPVNKLQAIPMSLKELRRRTEYPECFGRTELVSYLRHSKTTGNDIIAKYKLEPATCNPKLNILSRLCESEAKTLAAGIHKINNEYFPISYVADTMKESLGCELPAPRRQGNGKETNEERKEVVNSTIDLLENLKGLLRNPKGELAKDLDIFERATHTFGCENMINHISFFEDCLEELKKKL